MYLHFMLTSETVSLSFSYTFLLVYTVRWFVSPQDGVPFYTVPDCVL